MLLRFSLSFHATTFEHRENHLLCEFVFGMNYYSKTEMWDTYVHRTNSVTLTVLCTKGLYRVLNYLAILSSSRNRQEAKTRKFPWHSGRDTRSEKQSILVWGQIETASWGGGGDSFPIPGSTWASVTHPSFLPQKNGAKTNMEGHFRCSHISFNQPTSTS